MLMPFQLEGDSAIYTPTGNILHLRDTLSYDKPETWRDGIRKKISLNTTVFLAREDVKGHLASLSFANFKDRDNSVSLNEIEAVCSNPHYEMVVVYSPEEVSGGAYKRFNKLEDLRPYLLDSVVSLKPNAKILCVVGWPMDSVKRIIPKIEDSTIPDSVPAPVQKVAAPPAKNEKVAVLPVPKSAPKFYTLADQMPNYPGGHDGIARHISSNLRYPEAARGATGTVYVSYIVDVNGRATNVQLVTGVNPYLDEEALRVVKTLSGFSPGVKDGRSVPVQLNQKVIFTK